MFVVDNVKLATRTFKTRKLRTFLTVLGISVGIGTTLFLVSLGYGMQKILLEKIAKSDALLTLDVTSTNTKLIKIDQKVLSDFQNIPNVEEVSPLRIFTSQLKINNTTSNVTLNTIKGSFFRLGGIELLKGKPFQADKEPSIVLSSGALISLGIDDFDEALNQTVEVALIVPKATDQERSELITENETVNLDGKFKVVGIVEDNSESLGYIPSGWTSNLAVDSYDEVKIKISNQGYLESVRNDIIEKGFTVLALTDTVDQANKIFSIVQFILALFGIVALIVSAIGMFNTMTIALLERTNEIGIMKAIGASNREIKFLFLTEAIIIGVSGGVGGVAIGFIGTRVVNSGFNILAKSLGGEPINIFYTPFWFIAFVLIFSTFIGLITGVYPASRASRLNPLDALRYK